MPNTNQTIENTVKDVIATKLSDGTVERIMEAEFEKAIQKAFSDIFNSYRGAGKEAIEKQLESVIVPYLESYDFSKYVMKLDTVLIDILEHTTFEHNTILNNFKELMLPEKIEKITISDIAEKWSEFVMEREEESRDFEFSFRVEESTEPDWVRREQTTIYFECEEHEEYNIAIKLYRYNWKFDWKIERNALFTLNSLLILDEFEMFILRLVQCCTKVEIDETEHSWEIDRYEN